VIEGKGAVAAAAFRYPQDYPQENGGHFEAQKCDSESKRNVLYGRLRGNRAGQIAAATSVPWTGYPTAVRDVPCASASAMWNAWVHDGLISGQQRWSGVVV